MGKPAVSYQVHALLYTLYLLGSRTVTSFPPYLLVTQEGYPCNCYAGEGVQATRLPQQDQCTQNLVTGHLGSASAPPADGPRSPSCLLSFSHKNLQGHLFQSWFMPTLVPCRCLASSFPALQWPALSYQSGLWSNVTSCHAIKNHPLASFWYLQSYSQSCTLPCLHPKFWLSEIIRLYVYSFTL